MGWTKFKFVGKLEVKFFSRAGLKPKCPPPPPSAFASYKTLTNLEKACGVGASRKRFHLH